MIILKSKEQLEKMRKVGQIVAKTLELMEENVKVGVTTKQLDKLAEDYIRSQGAIPSFKGYGGFPTAICASPNEQIVHGFPNDEPLKEGDIISIDVGAFKYGFHADAARTFPVGVVKKEIQDLIDVTKQSFYEGLKEVKIGNRIGDISNAIQTYVEKHGYSIVRELVGHGVGKELHEDPQVPNFGAKNSGPKIESGLVIAIEPMVNLGKKEVVFESDGWTTRTKDKKPSAHYENTVAITEDGVEILTV